MHLLKRPCEQDASTVRATHEDGTAPLFREPIAQRTNRTVSIGPKLDVVPSAANPFRR